MASSFNPRLSKFSLWSDANVSLDNSEEYTRCRVASFPDLMDRKKCDIMKWTQTNPKSQEELLCQSKKEQCHLVMTMHLRVARSNYNSVRPQSALNWLSPVEYEHLLSVYAAKVAWQWVAGMIGLCLGELPLGYFVLSPVHHGRQRLVVKQTVEYMRSILVNERNTAIHFVFWSFFVSIFAGRAHFFIFCLIILSHSF